jgi:hypothetical protein
MKPHDIIVFFSVFALAACVSKDSEPWTNLADSLVGRELTTVAGMVVVQRGDHHLLVPVGKQTRRFTRTTEYQKVIASVPIGAKVHIKKKIFRVSKPGRDDYLVVDVISQDGAHRGVWLIVGSLFLTGENFVGI